MPVRRAFAAAFVGFFLLAAAWALALPTNGTYDEHQHLVRAYAVWTGQFYPHARGVDDADTPAEVVEAPRSLLPQNVSCTWRPKPPKPASCQLPVTDRTDGPVPTTAGLYSPVYYLAVGLPLRLSPDSTGLVFARLLSAATSALLLAAAAAIAAQRGNKLLLAALVLVSTPLAMNLAGAINPNGLEISAGVLLFTALLAALRSPTRPLLIVAGVASALLLTVRSLGPVLFAFVVLACVLFAGRGLALALLRRRDTLTWFGGLSAAGVAFYVFWLLSSRVTDVTPDRGLQLGLGDILKGIATTRGVFYLRQIVGQFSYGETPVSPVMILLWYVLMAALVIPALWLGSWRVRLAIGGIAVVSALLLIGLEVHFVPLRGWYAHGRYVMPLAVGVVIAAAYVDGFAAWLTRRGWLDSVVLALVAITVPLDLYALARVMTRFQVGINAGLQPFGGSWQPASGPVLPLLACLLGGLLLTSTVLVRAARPVAEPEKVSVG
ncbi:DUF2142 domain-containing protein [Dactylosporangium sp. NPDC051484]|uniref:DUF2142 domain-containing protein n=1 Tax=Dactylosporangium sp. NPDC051484 TaxID=3154942 RepID=UPI00344E99B0